MNIGGRPMASWTTFIVPSYELTILFAALTAAIGMIVLSGLPQPYHPVFNVERFSMASSDKFFLVIESTDPKFGEAAAFLHEHGREGSVRRCGISRTRARAAVARDGARAPAAARTCTTRRATRRSRRARRSPTTARRGRAPAGTVARGWLRDDEALYTGKIAGQPVDQFPFAIGRDELVRGQQRFNIYCTPCHGKLGDGKGMVVQRGLRQAASYHQDRLRQEKLGYFYDVITNGFGAMQGYAEQIPVRDRWLIVAYVRTLQLSQHASVERRARGSPRRARRGGRRDACGHGEAGGRPSRRRNTSVDSDCDFGNLSRRPARRCRACGSSA